ncbi:MAG: TQO small subunit DoxD [Candidatus Thorarchaeota archaeon]
MEMTQKQWITIILVIIIDVILIAISVLALSPMWTEPNANLLVPNLSAIMAPLLILPIVLVPTVLLLRWGWPDLIDLKALLFPLRMALAYEFLHGGIEKLMDSTYLASPGLIGYGSAAAPSPWIQEVLTGLLANYQGFLLLIAVGELLIGLSLFFGAFTRLGALGGVIMQWTFMFLLGWLSISTFGLNFVGAAAFLVLGMYQSGRFIGLDQFIGPKLDEATNPILRFIAWLT